MILIWDELVGTDSTDEDGLVHYVCCDPERALCGKDLTDGTWSDDEDDLICIVCERLDLAGVVCGPDCRGAGKRGVDV